MILLDIDMPKSCFDCRFRADTGECELTGLYASSEAYVMPLSYDCPIKAEIPKNATNGDVIKAMFPNVGIYEHGSTISVNNEYNFNSTWWNAPWRVNDESRTD